MVAGTTELHVVRKFQTRDPASSAGGGTTAQFIVLKVGAF